MRKLFGTDGVRGTANIHPMTGHSATSAAFTGFLGTLPRALRLLLCFVVCCFVL